MKFNILSRNKGEVRNHEGATAWQMTPEMELYTAVVTTSLSNKFYEKADERLKRIQELVSKSDPEFVAKLAVYAREQMYLRSVPLVLAVELAKLHKGDDLVSRLVGRVVQRADEITELLACYQIGNARSGSKKLGKLSKQVQKGLAAAFNKFDEYQFAKYNRAADVKLRDALFLVHPKPKSAEQQVLFDKIAQDTLSAAFTWETELSKLGQEGFEDADDKQTAFAGKWEEMIDSGRLGYMALLRNLRNMLEAKISSAHVLKVAQKLADGASVRKSKQFPFRFLSAYRELEGMSHTSVPMLLEALEAAVRESVHNMPGFGDDIKVFISSDVSSSMFSPVSANSKVGMYDVGLLLSMLLQSKCKQVITSIFGESHKVVNLPRTAILSNTMKLRSIEGSVGYATNGWKVIQHLIDQKLVVDKVMLFTDCQMYGTQGTQTISDRWAKYKHMAPNASLYVFDLQGYGQAPLKLEANGVFLVAGWSEKVFEVMDAIEHGSDALSEIRSIVL